MPTSANGFSMSCDGGEANATKIAEQAAQGPHSTADATFIEAYVTRPCRRWSRQRWMRTSKP
jgi:hypothetical protein